MKNNIGNILEGTKTYYAGLYLQAVNESVAINKGVTPCKLCKAYNTKACGSEYVGCNGVFWIKYAEDDNGWD